MALHNTLLSNAHLHSSTFFLIITTLLILPSTTNSIFFTFPSSANNNKKLIHVQGDTVLADNAIQLTKNGTPRSVGLATYSNPIQLWDATTKRLADFDTHFSFVVGTLNDSEIDHGTGGFSFFLAPFQSKIPLKSGGDYVAVEFYTYRNARDPSLSHVGINIIQSLIYVANESIDWDNMKIGAEANAFLRYDSTTKNLNVTLTFDLSGVSNSASLYHIFNLSNVLPENVCVGFWAASTNTTNNYQKIHSWKFNSHIKKTSRGISSQLVVGLIVGLDVVGCLIGFVIFIWWSRKRRLARKSELDAENADGQMDDVFENGTGPKRFLYSELVYATNNFHEAGKLGEGGFGGVYRGFLSGINLDIAVKRISKGSQQGKREYKSEVRVISQLRHRNLVQLLGWSHERNELLLVYEFMPNQSLDKHLFRGAKALTWEVRYKIALGLASALLYLHELWEQCVLHRDIKASNVMLDSDFNAKLGDFGLARLVDHQLGSQTTVLAGTLGYLAPECIYTSKSSKESDVYSFGIVALEIACGRKPVEQNKENLVDWVWELYANGKIVEAADKRLNMAFDVQQMEHLLVLGLWCAHPDPTTRPSIRQVKNLLNYESPLVNLPTKLPSPVYNYAPRLHMCKLAFDSACADHSKSQTDGSQCKCSNCTNASLSQISTKPSVGSSSSESLMRSC